MGASQWGTIISNGSTYRARFNYFNYHRRPKYRINFQLVLNAAYSCPSSILTYALVIKTKSNSISARPRKCKTMIRNIERYNYLSLHLGAIKRARLLNRGRPPGPLRTPCLRSLIKRKQFVVQWLITIHDLVVWQKRDASFIDEYCNWLIASQ